MAAKRKYNKRTRKGKVSSGVGHEIAAISLIAASILLTIAYFGGGGSLANSLTEVLRVIIGATTYMLPVILIFFAVRLFMAKDEKLNRSSIGGLVLIILALAAFFHLPYDVNESLVRAQDGDGGGFIGYLLTRAGLTLLSKTALGVLLAALTLIGAVLLLNLRFSELFAKLWAAFRERESQDLASQMQKSSGEPKINAKVPLITNQNDEESEPEAPETQVLTSPSDPDWKLPGLDLLEDKHGEADAGKPKVNAEIIQATLSNFGIKVDMQEINIGPTVTQYTLKPDSNVRLSKITELANNLELALAAHPIRIEAPIPGKSAVGIEVPNRRAATVRLKELFSTEAWRKHSSPLAFALGRDIGGKATVVDLVSMPHLLVAGATGSGKSIMVNSLLMGLLYRHSPADLKLILVDPKRVELKGYDDIPHLLSPVITEPEKCISALKWAVAEMERRYSVFADLGKRNISEYNKIKDQTHMPFIVIIIDELADLMMMAPQDVESLIVRIAQKARATGIHLVIATQRPSVNVITGLIKANITARVAFSTVSQVDSRTIIDQAGADKLLGKGDMLFLSPTHIKPHRIQGIFVSEKEVKDVANFLRKSREPTYNEDVLTQSVKLGGRRGSVEIDNKEDDMLMEASQLVIESRKASASLLQRRLRIGYARAARLLDMMEERGIVSPPDGARPRDVLVNSVNEITGGEESSTE